MNPEQRKNHRGGARVQKPESPRREKETKREKKPGRPRTKKQKILLGLYIALTVVAAIIVAGAIVFGLMSAPPEVALPTPPAARSSFTLSWWRASAAATPIRCCWRPTMCPTRSSAS